MKRILLVVAYDGTNYHGWQIQPNGITIESELNRCLSELLRENIQVSGASRTDSGVHALCNLAVFDTDARMPGEKIALALNQRLPEDIRIRRSMEVEPGFHPRFAETIKTYEYRIWNDSIMLPAKRLNTHFCYYRLDIDRMREASRYLLGEHDFAGFCSSGAQVESTVREITAISVNTYSQISEPQHNGTLMAGGGQEIVIRVSGKGFLYNMVRIIAGTLIEVGRGVMEPVQVRDALESCDRNLAGPTAPARGLTLVEYELL